MWQTADQVMMYDIKISQSMHVQYIRENPRAKLPHGVRRVTKLGCPTIYISDFQMDYLAVQIFSDNYIY